MSGGLRGLLGAQRCLGGGVARHVHGTCSSVLGLDGAGWSLPYLDPEPSQGCPSKCGVMEGLRPPLGGL